jgi:hypothetical protein
MKNSISRWAGRAAVVIVSSLAVVALTGKASARDQSAKPKISCSCWRRPANGVVSVEDTRQTKGLYGGLNGKSWNFSWTTKREA